jgi:hypothetical protein
MSRGVEADKSRVTSAACAGLVLDGDSVANLTSFVRVARQSESEASLRRLASCQRTARTGFDSDIVASLNRGLVEMKEWTCHCASARHVTKQVVRQHLLRREHAFESVLSRGIQDIARHQMDSSYECRTTLSCRLQE